MVELYKSVSADYILVDGDRRTDFLSDYDIKMFIGGFNEWAFDYEFDDFDRENFQLVHLEYMLRNGWAHLKPLKGWMAAFEAFMEADFESACDSPTQAYSVELSENGTYKILCDDELQNDFDSSKLILEIAPLEDENEWNKEMRERFSQALKDL